MTEEDKHAWVKKSIDTYRAIVEVTSTDAGEGCPMTHEEKEKARKDLNAQLVECGNQLEKYYP